MYIKQVKSFSDRERNKCIFEVNVRSCDFKLLFDYFSKQEVISGGHNWTFGPVSIE